MLTSDDLKKYNAFKKIIHSGNFSFKGDACLFAGVLFKWFDDLGKEIEKQASEEGKILKVKINEPGEGRLNAD